MSKRRVIVAPLVNTVAGMGASKLAKGRHLEPGLVAYDNEDGSRITYLLPLEAIAAMRPSAVGKPIVGKSGDFDHLKIEQGKKYDGAVTDSVWDGESGWECINFSVDDAKTAEACRKGFELSCAYIPTDVDETPGLWHNIPYDAVIKNGEYTHFAVVPNPRYEGAAIEILNSLNGGIVNKVLKAALSFVPFAQLKEVFNSMEVEEKEKAGREEKKNAAMNAAKTAFDAAMLNAKTDEEKAAAKSAFDMANAEAEKLGAPAAAKPEEPLGGGNVPPEPGMPGLVPEPPVVPNAAPPAPVETPEQAQLREKAALEKKNADDAAAAEAKKKADAEKTEKEKVEVANALKIKTEAEAKALKEAQRRERFNSLKRLAEERGGNVGSPFVGHASLQDKEDLGRERYGSRQ